MKKDEMGRLCCWSRILKAAPLSPFPSPLNGRLRYPLGRNAKLALQEINMLCITPNVYMKDSQGGLVLKDTFH